MVDSQTIETKFEEKKEKYEERKEKGKTIADNVANDLSKSIDEFKESLKSMQKVADQKFNEYKQSTVQNLDVDLIESDENYYLKVATPDVKKENINIEAGDNDIAINVTFKSYADELEDVENKKVIISNLKKGQCIKTVRFENSIDVEKISAKFSNGTVKITLPKLIIPKHKVNVE